jgi:hypothetical protein
MQIKKKKREQQDFKKKKNAYSNNFGAFAVLLHLDFHTVCDNFWCSHKNNVKQAGRTNDEKKTVLTVLELSDAITRISFV